jgi:hypothetical protein
MKRKITISIDINWGSQFQMDWLEESLNILLLTWKNIGESKHKDNKITYVMDTNDGYKKTQV